MSLSASSSDINSKTSLTLIDRAVGRSEEAWEEMMRTYFPLIRYWARGAGLNEHDAENICQEVFVRLIRFLSRFQPTKPVGSFRSWLKTITQHSIFEHRERNRDVTQGLSFFLSLAEQGDSLSDSDSSRATEQRLVWRQVMEIVCGEFSTVHATAFHQIVIEQLSADQVARNLNISTNVVYQVKSRILSRIRQRLEQLIEKCDP